MLFILCDNNVTYITDYQIGTGTVVVPENSEIDTSCCGLLIRLPANNYPGIKIVEVIMFKILTLAM